ncbi:MAG: polymorphic toxin-type HINT domain-containing protein, partial [Litorimonas sp.]
TVERLYLETGEPLAKWTGTVLTYLHADHIGTPRRGTHGLGAQDDTSGNPASPGAEVFADFSTPFGMSPTPAWHGDAGSGFAPATGPGSNCGVTGFTTHVRDCQTGLEYMQTRYYDPVSARFTSNDPVGFIDQPYPGQVNRYAYTWNNPINATDPNGEFLKVIKSVYNVGKRTYKNGGNVKGALKDEALSYIENGATLIDPNASVGDKLFAAFDLATGFGDEAKGAKRLVTGCKGCFVAGTLVDTEDGLRPIETLEVGDLVWAKDDVTGDVALKPITHLIRPGARPIFELTTVAAEPALVASANSLAPFSGKTTVSTFHVTDDHPWWVEDKGWLRTDQIASGMMLTSRDGQSLKVAEITRTDRVEEAFNFTVADYHTYFVGEAKVWVHNCPTGSYTNFHASGKTYDGKGNSDRAASSGRRVAAQNDDPLVRSETRIASTDRESFKQESRSLDSNGGPQSDSNYNKIESPGKRYRREDDELE